MEEVHTGEAVDVIDVNCKGILYYLSILTIYGYIYSILYMDILSIYRYLHIQTNEYMCINIICVLIICINNIHINNILTCVLIYIIIIYNIYIYI